MKRVGCYFWAMDYGEPVFVVAIEKRGRFTIRRACGTLCFNYPSYLLGKWHESRAKTE